MAILSTSLGTITVTAAPPPNELPAQRVQLCLANHIPQLEQPNQVLELDAGEDTAEVTFK